MSNQLPVLISAEAAVKSKRPDYVSLFDPKANIKDLKKCRSDPAIIKEAVKKLKEFGFSVISVGSASVCFIGSRKAFEDAFSISFDLSPERGKTQAVPHSTPKALPSEFITVTSGILSNCLATLMFEPPSYLREDRTRENNNSKERLPSDIYLDEVPRCLRKSSKTLVTGWTVKIAIIDSGCYRAHEFFKNVIDLKTKSAFGTDAMKRTAESDLNRLDNLSKTASRDLRIIKLDPKGSLSKTKIKTLDRWLETYSNEIKEELSLKMLVLTKDYEAYCKTIKNGQNDTDRVKALINLYDVIISFLTGRIERLQSLQKSADSDSDFEGHGTLVCANVFALAPAASVTSWKMFFQSSLSIHGKSGEQATMMQKPTLLEALKEKPDIVNLSMGSNAVLDDTLSQQLASWVELVQNNRGVLFLIAAGNAVDKAPSLEAHLDEQNVIVVGGAFWENVPQIFTGEAGELDEKYLRAANRAHGHSKGQNYRAIPDICGLVANKGQNDQYAGMLWCPNGEVVDAVDADTWTKTTGTSIATPQLSGVCALLKEAFIRATPFDIKTILLETASPVKAGFCHDPTNGKADHILWSDEARKAGFVHVDRAIALAEFGSIACAETEYKSIARVLDLLYRDARTILGNALAQRQSEVLAAKEEVTLADDKLLAKHAAKENEADAKLNLARANLRLAEAVFAESMTNLNLAIAELDAAAAPKAISNANVTLNTAEAALNAAEKELQVAVQELEDEESSWQQATGQMFKPLAPEGREPSGDDHPVILIRQGEIELPIREALDHLKSLNP